MYAFFGAITFGVSHLTGPARQTDRRRASRARHDVIRGKPVLQEIGDELDERRLEFFFDEVFCDVGAEWGKLLAAYQAKEAQPFISGASYNGRRYVVDELSDDVQRTTRRGSVTRISSGLTLIESPTPDLLTQMILGIRAAAPAIGRADAKPPALR